MLRRHIVLLIAMGSLSLAAPLVLFEKSRLWVGTGFHLLPSFHHHPTQHSYTYSHPNLNFLMCTVTESPIFFKLCEIKVSLCNKEMTKAYDPLFRNTWENRIKIQEDICSVSYSLFCTAIQKVRCGRAVLNTMFLVVTSVVRIAISIFFLFRPSYFQGSFLFSSFSFCLSFTINNFC